MRGGGGYVLSDLPARGRWDFGGYPYGYEPLTLPMPGSPDLVDALPAAATYAEVCVRIRALGRDPAVAAGVEPCPHEETLYWFRWITGHQVTFVIWRLMSGVLEAVADGGLAPEAAVRPLSVYVRGYCGMLLYTGSCPRDTYERVIRPGMRLRHPSFSGSWAPDYGPVRDLLRRRIPRLEPPATTPDLAKAIALHELIHDGIAARLVPDGQSLLRGSGVGRQDARLLHALYDNYFVTSRAPVPRAAVVGQLLRRLVAVAQDLAANTLYPVDPVAAGEQPGSLAAPEVRDCADALGDIVGDVADAAVWSGSAMWPDGAADGKEPLTGAGRRHAPGFSDDTEVAAWSSAGPN